MAITLLEEHLLSIRTQRTPVMTARTNCLKRSPFYCAAKLFINLPNNIWTISNLENVVKTIQTVNLDIMS